MASSYKKETKKQKIIRAAILLFRNAHNVNKVSIEDIAGEANVSPTTIYNNFINRNSLIAEVIKYLVLARLESYLTIMKADMPFPQKIRLIMTKKIEAGRELDWESIIERISQDAQLADLSEKMFKNQVHPLLFELIEDGKRQGYIEPTLSAEAIIMYLDILKEGGGAYFRFLHAPRANEEILEELHQIILYGFVKRDINGPERNKKKAKK